MRTGLLGHSSPWRSLLLRCVGPADGSPPCRRPRLPCSSGWSGWPADSIGFARADGPRVAVVSRRSRPPPRLPDRVVVLHRQPDRRQTGGTSATSSPSSAARWPPEPATRPRLRLGHRSGLHGAFRPDRCRQPAASAPSSAFARGAAGLAGAQARPYRVWLEDWSVAEASAGRRRACGRPRDDLSLDLTLDRPHRARCSRAIAATAGRGRSPATPPTTTASRGSRPPAAVRVGGTTHHGHRPELDGSRVQHQRLGSGPGGLGLVRASTRRRERADGLPASPGRWQRRRVLQRHDRGR